MAKLNRKAIVKNRVAKYVDEDGKNRIIKVNTACKTFGSPIIDLETGNFIYDDGMAKCEKCPADVKSACIVHSQPEIKMAKTNGGAKYAALNAIRPKIQKDKEGKVILDKWGQRAGSRTSQMLILVSKRPMKMAEIKKAMARSYYQFNKKYPEILVKHESGVFYVAGEKSEAMCKGKSA